MVAFRKTKSEVIAPRLTILRGEASVEHMPSGPLSSPTSVQQCPDNKGSSISSSTSPMGTGGSKGQWK
eukprot:12906701-Prorocentrum_lima.AAC.1